MGADILPAAEGGDPVGERHAVSKIVQQLPLLGVDEGDILVDEGVEGGALRQYLLVGHDVGRGIQLVEPLLALQIAGDEHAGGQLGGGDLVVVDEAVAQIGRAVRRDDADVAGGVARQLQYAEAGAGHIQMVVLRADDDVGGEALLQKQLAALAVGQGHIVGPVAVGIHGDAGLDELDGGGAAVALLEIADVAGVVEVGVGADDAPQTQAVVVDETGQAGTIQLGVAGVDEDDVPVGEKVDGQQGGGALRRPCAAQYVLEFHGSSLQKRCFPHYTPRRGKNKFFCLPPMQNRRNKVEYLREKTGRQCDGAAKIQTGTH